MVDLFWGNPTYYILYSDRFFPSHEMFNSGDHMVLHIFFFFFFFFFSGGFV